MLEILGEILLQVVVETLAELGLHSLTAPSRKRPNPWMAGIGYSIFGAGAGRISLWLVPAHLVTEEPLRILNLVVTPVVAGLLMSLMGVWRARRGDTLLRLDHFAYGYLFALSLALVRFFFAT
jgi:hypothetical protein